MIGIKTQRQKYQVQAACTWSHQHFLKATGSFSLYFFSIISLYSFCLLLYIFFGLWLVISFLVDILLYICSCIRMLQIFSILFFFSAWSSLMLMSKPAQPTRTIRHPTWPETDITENNHGRPRFTLLTFRFWSVGPKWAWNRSKPPAA